MAATLFLTVWVLILVAYVAMIGLCFATIPQLKRTFPDQFTAAGSPSPWTSPSIDFKFLGYLVKGGHLAISNQRLKSRLSALKYVWLVFFSLILAQLVVLAIGVGA